MIEIYITNLGKYVEGALCGEYLKLPATREDVKALLSRIGVDGVRYEEIFITDYETEIEGLSKHMGEYESVDELSYLAVLLSGMNDWDMKKFEAVLEYGEYTGSVKDLINLTQNLDCYEYNPDIMSDQELGYYYVDELGVLEVPDYLTNYIDYEAYGRDIRMDEGGLFTDNGYVTDGRDTFTEYYGGRDDLPNEHRIFSYPEQLEVIPDDQSLKLTLKPR